jgi:hypothetical protein
MKFEGSTEMFGKECATFERIGQIEAPKQSKPKLVENGIPRRNRLDLNTPAELSIFNAMQEVDKIGADTRLTEAVILLGKAKELVADYVDA